MSLIGRCNVLRIQSINYQSTQGRLQRGKWTQLASSLAQGGEEFYPQGGEFPQICGSY